MTEPCAPLHRYDLATLHHIYTHDALSVSDVYRLAHSRNDLPDDHTILFEVLAQLEQDGLVRWRMHDLTYTLNDTPAILDVVRRGVLDTTGTSWNPNTSHASQH